MPNEYYTTAVPHITDLYPTPIEAINALRKYWQETKRCYSIDFHVIENNPISNLYDGREFRIMGHWAISSDEHTLKRLD